MKRLLKSWVFWAFVAPPLGLACALFFGSLRRLEVCPDCASERVVRFWYAGMAGRRVRISPERVELTESHVLRDFLAADHAHRWAVRQTSAGSWLISTCGVGAASSVNGWRQSYEYSAEFREFVRSKLASGTVGRGELVEAQSADAKFRGLRKLGDDWLEEFANPGR